jgi:acyl-CoA thioesterase
VFGGQVIGQAVTVSNRSVREDVRLHSLHCYFLLAGDETIPIYYQVSRLRDGGSYVTRLVEAKQRGRCIFVLFTSYAKPEPERPRFAIPQPASIDHAYSSSNGINSSSHTSGSDSAGTGNGNPEDARPASASSTPSTPSSSDLRTGQSSIESRFSKNRTTNGEVLGLIPYDKAESNEERYIRVLSEHGDTLPKKVQEVLRGWIKDREESSIEIRWVLSLS